MPNVVSIQVCQQKGKEKRIQSSRTQIQVHALQLTKYGTLAKSCNFSETQFPFRSVSLLLSLLGIKNNNKSKSSSNNSNNNNNQPSQHICQVYSHDNMVSWLILYVILTGHNASRLKIICGCLQDCFQIRLAFELNRLSKVDYPPWLHYPVTSGPEQNKRQSKDKFAPFFLPH